MKKRSISENKQIIWDILEIGKEMIVSGAEIWRVSDSLYRLLSAYGFSELNVWVISTNIQATVRDEDGEIYSQSRSVRDVSYNLNKLDRLNDLSRYACDHTPESAEFNELLEEIVSIPGPSKLLVYLANALGVFCLVLFFSGGFTDAIVGAIVALVFVWLGNIVGRHEGNPLVYNVFVSFVMEVLIILFVLGGVGRDVNSITIAIILLVIGSLGLTNGVLDLIERDTLSGIIETINSLLKASGVAIGISLAMLLFKKTLSDMMLANSINTIKPTDLMSNTYLLVLFGTIGSLCFALLFGIKGKKIFFCGLGALMTRLVYLLVLSLSGESEFIATFAAAAFIAANARVMARINKSPSTVFMTTSVLPILPGSHLYFTIYYAIMEQYAKMAEHGNQLLLVLLGISFGYIVVEFITKYMTIFMRKMNVIVDQQVHID